MVFAGSIGNLGGEGWPPHRGSKAQPKALALKATAFVHLGAQLHNQESKTICLAPEVIKSSGRSCYICPDQCSSCEYAAMQFVLACSRGEVDSNGERHPAVGSAFDQHKAL
eukprot:scaffold146548_cov19-Tisochrysis_lutea.AAC.1